MFIEDEELETRFSYHPPKPGQTEKYTIIRDQAKSLARTIRDLTPPSREQSTSLTKLDEVVMHANAAIARREK